MSVRALLWQYLHPDRPLSRKSDYCPKRCGNRECPHVSVTRYSDGRVWKVRVL